MIDKENAAMLNALLDNAKVVGPQILAEDYLSQCAGMVGYALVRGDIESAEHANYWAQITSIREARALAKKAHAEASAA